MARIRLDKLLVKRSIAENIDEATDLIEQGKILVNGALQTSCVNFVDAGSAIEFVPQPRKYVSRGGYKLEHALEVFSISPHGKRCLDIGASTGGFTDCLLQHGANHVVALDVGHGQIDLSLRNDERVTVLEKTNARDITPEMIEGVCELGVADVSFTSIIPLIPPVMSCLDPQTFIVLIKPQFECDVRFVNTRGIVTDPEAHKACIVKVRDALDKVIMTAIDVSPIKGNKGNVEYLCLLQSAATDAAKVTDARINDVVTQAYTEYL